MQEEHLEDAAFLFQQWEEALRSPEYTLEEIADGPEGRLLAHLDGLVLGGAAVAEKLLVPALGGDEPGAVFAAAFALLCSEDGDFTPAVLEALAAAEDEPRRALRRGLAVAPVEGLAQRLAGLAAGAAQPDLLEVLAARGVDPALPLDGLAAADDPVQQALALRLARAFRGRLSPLALERGYRSEEPEVRAAALESGMALGHPGAWSACEATVAARGPGFASAALLLGLSGDARSAAALTPALREPEHAAAAAFALGFSGQVSAAEALLPLLRDGKLAPLALEAFAAITGLPLTPAHLGAPERWDPEQEDGAEPGYGPEAELPAPAPEAVSVWWQEARQRLAPGQRWLRGAPWSAGGLLRELSEGPARRREALALELAIRSRGQAAVTWDALTQRQREELAAARGLAGRLPGRGFGE
ncbi:MAG: TIGR02270 family protein [Anaeromyxobacter sp.]